MAGTGSESEDQAEDSHGPRECMPCRGTGKVISNLGGTPSTVTCPWCDGGGVRLPGVDAQAKWLESDTAADAQAE
jgi:DnaJ-class molecular chaperone